MGDGKYGINPPTLTRIAGEVKELVEAGLEVAMVIGGGNIFRYNLVAGFGDLERDKYNIMTSISLSDAKVLRGDQRDFVNTFQPNRGVSPDTRGTPIATVFAISSIKTGLTGAESSTFMLPRLVGLRKAMELVLLSPRLTAREALAEGLINSVHPDGELDAAALALAARLAELPTEAVGVAKDLLNRAAGLDRLDVHLDAELTELARIADGKNFAEGIAAFFGKRAPAFGSE